MEEKYYRSLSSRRTHSADAGIRTKARQSRLPLMKDEEVTGELPHNRKQPNKTMAGKIHQHQHQAKKVQID